MSKKVTQPPQPGPAPTILETPSLAPSTFTDGLPLPKLLIFDLDYTLWPFWTDTHVVPPVKGKDNNTRVVDRINESFTFYPAIPPLLHACALASLPIALASRTSAPDLALQILKILHIPPASSYVTSAPSPIPSSSTSTTSLAPPSPTPSSASTTTLTGPPVPTTPTTNPPSPNQISKAKTNLLSKPPPSSPATSPRRALDFFAHTAIYPGDKKSHMAKLQRSSGVPYEEMLFFDDERRNANVESLGVTFWLVADGVTREEVDRGVREWRRRRGLKAGKGTVAAGK